MSLTIKHVCRNVEEGRRERHAHCSMFCFLVLTCVLCIGQAAGQRGKKTLLDLQELVVLALGTIGNMNKKLHRLMWETDIVYCI